MLTDFGSSAFHDAFNIKLGERTAMKIRLDEDEGLAADTAIEVQAGDSRTPESCVTVGIWNGDVYASVELTAERARQLAAALIGTGAGGGDAG